MPHRGGLGAGIDECRIGGLYDIGAFAGTVAYEENRAPGQNIGETLLRHDLRSGIPDLPAGDVEYGAVHLHSPRVYHRHDVAAALRKQIPVDGLPYESVQRADPDHGDPRPETKSLGRGHTDPQAGVRAGAHAYADGVAVLDAETLPVQHFLDERRCQRGMPAPVI